MRMQEFAGTRFLGPEDVADTELVDTITAIELGRFGKPVVTLESGSRLSLNKSNVGRLIRTLGSDDSRAWIGCRIEISLGEAEFDGERRPSLVVRGLDRATPSKAAAPAKPKASSGFDMNDDIPF